MNKNYIYGTNNKEIKVSKNEDSIILQYVKDADVYNPPLFEKNMCRLYMNENLYGPSPKCIEILKNLEASDFYKYAYGGDLLLREAIAKAIGVESSMISLNHGAAESLNQVFKSVLGKDDLALLPKPGWSYYRSIVDVIGGYYKDYILTEEKESYAFNVKEIRNIGKKYVPKLIVITTPNMPTGNTITEFQLESIVSNLKDTLVVVDEAYLGFSDEYKLDSEYFIKKYDNIVFVRTFSKLYGLASQRIGYILANEKLIKQFSKLAPLFGIPYTSQLITKAAIEDKHYYDEISSNIISSRKYIKERIEALGNYKVFESHSNFILIEVLNRNTTDIVEYFRKHGYLIRNCSGYGLNSHIRLSIGTKEVNKRIIDLFEKYDYEKNK